LSLIFTSQNTDTRDINLVGYLLRDILGNVNTDDIVTFKSYIT